MAGENDQNIDLIGLNQGGQGAVFHAPDITVEVEFTLKPFRDLIGLGHVAIANGGHPLPIVCLQDGLKGIGRRMTVEVRTQIADAQPPFGCGIVAVDAPRQAKGRVTSTPCLMHGGQGRGIDLRVVVTVKEQLGKDVRVVRKGLHIALQPMQPL